MTHWHRYNDDGYGEHEDGSPFDGRGVGRAWPLIAGERAHYELAVGRKMESEKYLRVLASSANEGGLIPEQIWDAETIPERELYFGRPSGSAMPLVWAHAEYVTLLRSIRDNKVFGMPTQTVQRYQVEKRKSTYSVWRHNHKNRSIKSGRTFRIEVSQPATIHWSADFWRTARDTATRDSGFGMHVVDLPSRELLTGGMILFTIHWIQQNQWEGVDYSVGISNE